MEYRHYHQQAEALTNQSLLIDEAKLTSTFIHSLQKERGLSATYLEDNAQETLEALREQHRETDQRILHIQQGPHRSLLEEVWGLALKDDLSRIRYRVVNRVADWSEVRDFYTLTIKELIDTTVLNNYRYNADTPMRNFVAITALTTARENLGLMRATLSRIFTRGQAHENEIVELARYYGAFNQRLHAFYRDVDDDSYAAITNRLNSDSYQSVRKQIESVLTTGANKPLTQSTDSWWSEVTLVIDSMKWVEEMSYEVLTNQLDARTAKVEKKYTTFIITAAVVVTLVTVLTLFTVLRILRALSVLLGTLNQVIDTRNFKLRVSSEKVSDEFGHIGFSLNKLLDFTDALIKEKDVLAATDLLTGLFNRRYFTERANLELKRAVRYNHNVSLIMCDIDFFKSVNDRHGHATGDMVLKRFGQILSDNIRESDIVARWGGEEFIILLPESSAGDAAGLAEKLRQVVEMEGFSDVGRMTASFGVAQWLRNSEDLGHLCDRADDALYQAKGGGRNQVVIAP